MRRFLFVMMIIFIGVMSACSDPKVDSVSNTELTEREKALLGTTTDISFVYDFNLGDGYKELVLWIEKYESGELVDDAVLKMGTDLSENTGTIIFTATEENNKREKIDFRAGTSNGKGTLASASFDGAQIISEDNLIDLMSIWGGDIAQDTPIGGEMTLAAIAYLDADNNSISSVSLDSLNNNADISAELKEYDAVFLFRAEFIK